jgi:acyl-CoA synthetase (NDP forming)
VLEIRARLSKSPCIPRHLPVAGTYVAAEAFLPMAMENDVPMTSIAPQDTDLGRLLDPARHFDRPQDVLADATLDLGEKRAILSSWASDACAVESMPALRKPPGVKAPITFEEIMDALQALDGADPLQGAEPGRNRCGGPHRVGA